MPTLLEQTMPVYHFSERHSRVLPANPDHVWDALSGLTLDQLVVARPLVALRHLGSRGIATSRPLFTDGPITMVAVQAPEYALGAAVARPWQRSPSRIAISSVEEFIAFEDVGWVKYLTDFHVRPCPAGTVLSTETRGYSTDRATRHRFAFYWAAIRTGSGLIRRDILATVDRISRREQNAPGIG
ncbi:hypothetical protein [Parafrankia sp. EUN1f]|uniref:hypothetical protein n=1 Tax=Parafrankia sp. EUN1f TaxID=102897 RepID=UPI0001C4678E|nr:hypothetical protein [Parafrankia sp. EUN1f]EFC81279.1 conserved hypothetical protein [Parafrankia sp. EUN1f]